MSGWINLDRSTLGQQRVNDRQETTAYRVGVLSEQILERQPDRKISAGLVHNGQADRCDAEFAVWDLLSQRNHACLSIRLRVSHEDETACLLSCLG